ncbi:MAG TPA: hypothetical protein PKD74_04345 [Candidatus Dependentiae bacterium]|jgi:hypothetical protein|nr:hypothetical protein [Candidatus Dependentiae bacterium]
MKFSQYMVAAIAFVCTLQVGAVCRNGVCCRGGVCHRTSAVVKRVAIKRVAVRKCCRKGICFRSHSCPRRAVVAKKVAIRIGAACRNGMCHRR